MKLIIAGSRNAPSNLADQIDYLVEAHGWDVTEVVSGTAFGPDRWGETWATSKGFPVRRFRPDWTLFGKRAGIVRNKQMAEYGDALIAFWDFESRGTKNMIEEMKQRDKPVSICGFGAKPTKGFIPSLP